MWFLHQSVSEWRDNPRFNPTLMYALFPRTALLYPEDFKDLAEQTVSGKPKAFVLDRAILADRSAAFRGEWTAPTARTVASAMHVGTTSRWWWEPIRRAALRYAGVPESIIERNLEGLGAVDPAQPSDPRVDAIEPLAPQGTYKPVVTYISRQNSRRRLTPESHDELVAALEDRAAKLGWELVIVEAERMSKEEQLALAGRTTVSARAKNVNYKLTTIRLCLESTAMVSRTSYGCLPPPKVPLLKCSTKVVLLETVGVAFV